MSDAAAGIRVFANGEIVARRLSQGTRSLVAFPYAGGKGLVFKALGQALEGSIALWGIDPPGHGRSEGDPRRSIDQLVADYRTALPEDWRAGILLGQSMGGMVAFALTAELARAGQPPTGLVLAGTRPPGVVQQQTKLSALSDDDLLESMLRAGVALESWRQDRDAFLAFATPLRADLEAMESYRPSRENGPLRVPTLILGGTKDPLCPVEALEEWSEWIDDPRIVSLECGHMIAQQVPTSVADAIRDWASGFR